MASTSSTQPPPKRPRQGTPTGAVLLQNKYAPLSDLDTDDGSLMEFGEPDQKTFYARRKEKNNTPPPIIIPDKRLIEKVRLAVKEIQIKNYNFKYMSNNINLHIDTIDEYTKTKNELKTREIPNFTFTPRQDKPHAHVVCGLDHKPFVEQIKEELTSMEIETREIYLMRNTTRPLYLVIPLYHYTIKILEKKAQALLNTRVTWEPHFPTAASNAQKIMTPQLASNRQT